MQQSKDDQSSAPHKVFIEVISNGVGQLAPSFMIRTPLKVYLFNVPEATTRYIKSFRIREMMVTDMFFTRSNWKNFGGLIGFLLNRGQSIVTRLHGPAKLKFFVDSMQSFSDYLTSIVGTSTTQSVEKYEKLHSELIQEVLFTSEKYEDATFRISYIPLYDNLKSDVDLTHADVAFLLELKLSVAKIAELKIPKGPLLGKLKSGQAIALPDGREIHPDYVMEFDDSIDEKHNLLVVECTSLAKLNSLKSNPSLKDFVGGKKQMNYIVHFTLNDVLESSEYRAWMNHFGPTCTHLILNGSGSMLPMMDGMYLNRYVQHKLCPQIFPELYPTEHDDIKKNDLLRLDDNIVVGNPFSRFFIRRRRDKRQPEDEEISLGISAAKQSIDTQLFAKENLNSNIDELQKWIKDRTTPTQEFPKITFLGTASAVPSKYRTVSSYILETTKDCALLIDCGEGTYGQLLTLFGHENVKVFLRKLRAVFITHAHLDHTLGMTTVITQRYESFTKHGLHYERLIIVCDRVYRANLNLYSKNYQEIENLLVYIDYSESWIKHVTNTSIKIQANPIDVIQKLDDKSFFSKKCHLKNVVAVPVPHSQINSCAYVFDDLEGRRFVFSGDTLPCDLLVDQGINADVLVHEATFEDGMEDDAKTKAHCTIGQAVDIGKQMMAKHIILTHFSTRYRKVPPLPEYLDACNVGIAMDHMVVRYGDLQILTKLLPIYRIAYEDELNSLQDISAKGET